MPRENKGAGGVDEATLLLNLNSDKGVPVLPVPNLKGAGMVKPVLAELGAEFGKPKAKPPNDFTLSLAFSGVSLETAAFSNVLITLFICSSRLSN